MWNYLKLLFKSTPPLVIVVVTGVLLFTSVGLGFGTFKLVDRFRDNRFNKKLALSEKKVSDLTVEREQHLAAIEGLKLELSELEGKRKVEKAQVEAAKANVQQKIEELKDEDQRYKDEVNVANQPVDACERVRRSCERAKSLGLYPAGKACECEAESDDR